MSTLIALDMSTNPPTRRELQCDTQARLVITGSVGGGGGTSDTTEATQLAVKTAVQSIDAKTPAAGAAQPISAAALPLPTGAATAAAQATAGASLTAIDTAQGAKADARASWYDSAASVISLIKLLIASYVGAGSHVYGYTNGVLTTDAWTLFGITRVKTYAYTGGQLTGESDWV